MVYLAIAALPAATALAAAFPLVAIGPEPSRYVARHTTQGTEALLDVGDAPWGDAERITWGPAAVATSFRAVWSHTGLAVRFDVTDASPWHTLTERDEKLWTEEVVELFLDVGATGRAYAELEVNPVNTLVDLWVDRAEDRFDRGWDLVGLESRVHPRKDAAGRTTGWTAVAFLPWSALAAKAPPGTALPPKPGDRWRFNVFRIERPGGPTDPEKEARYLAWSPTGQHSFHVPEAFREIEFAPGVGASGACHEDSRVAMGATATVRVCGGDPAERRQAAADALDEVDRVDRLLSHYREASPLSRLNREAASGPVAVEPELVDVLALCLRWSRDSEGAFDVTVGPLMKAWGFFRDEGRLPDERQIRGALAVVGHQHVVLDRPHGTVRFDRPGVELDLGGIGKGYAVDRAVERLRRRGIASALVNLGGSSVYGLGAPPGAEAWQVAIEDPTQPGRKAEMVALRDRALSVSGGYARSFEQDGVTYSHIMDPRTGRPVSGVLSVAVLSSRATDGDALDNVLFVQGLEKARAFVARLAPSPPTSVYFFLPTAGTGWRLECFGTQE